MLHNHIAQLDRTLEKVNSNSLPQKAQMTLSRQIEEMGSHTSIQEKGFKLFRYLNLDGIVVHALVWITWD